MTSELLTKHTERQIIISPNIRLQGAIYYLSKRDDIQVKVKLKPF